jgi:hypothetical protein
MFFLMNEGSSLAVTKQYANLICTGRARTCNPVIRSRIVQLPETAVKGEHPLSQQG